MINPPSTNFAEQWVKQYTQLNKSISYKAFDFNGIKRSLIGYLRTYHPEHFNNLTETDELLPLIEMFAYVGELYAYRADVNSQEHILAAATRKSSAIQIANMLGYTPSRRTAGIGLVKITSVSTTESLTDVSGLDLQRRVIKWDDRANSRWKSQFEQVMNRVLNTNTGVFNDSDKTQIENITLERYVMNTNTLTTGVFPYTSSVNGLSVPMELVGTTLSATSITERSPTGARPLDILLAADGFGDSSPNTGYMLLTKQGTLSYSSTIFDGSAVNLAHKVNVSGINDTDVWLNAVNGDGSFVTAWTPVDNIAYNSSASRTIFQIVSLENDQITLLFGDGSYANVPVGRFDIWHRTSLEMDNSIPTSAILDQKFSTEYKDGYGNTQTFTCTFSLLSPIVTAASSESLEKLQQAVPGVFYTQDRMVTAHDHQTYLSQDTSVVKVKAVNRTFAGHSKYSSWYDGGEVYENVKIFGDDGVIYLEPISIIDVVANPGASITPREFINQQLTTMLKQPELWANIKLTDPTVQPREYFTPVEIEALHVELSRLSGGEINLTWQPIPASWAITPTPGNITIRLDSATAGWVITAQTTRTIVHSASTRFWQYSSLKARDYDSMHPTADLFTVLKANSSKSGMSTLSSDVVFGISGNIRLQSTLPNQSSVDTSRVLVLAKQSNDINHFTEMEYHTAYTGSSIRLPYTFTVRGFDGYADVVSVQGYGATGNVIPMSLVPKTVLSGLSNTVEVVFTGDTPASVVVTLQSYVYFHRPDLTSPLVPIKTTDTVKRDWMSDVNNSNYVRFIGRDSVNFLWQHFTSDFELVDPARTNIIDLYIITKQYLTGYMRWLRDASQPEPVIPSVLQLNAAYSKYLDKSMMSDELILRPGKFKVLFGPHSDPTLRATIQIVLPPTSAASNDAIKQHLVGLVRKYFDILNVEFGDTFYFSNLSAYLHANSTYALGSVLLVPLYPGYQFGDLYELTAAPDEVFVADISASDIQIVTQLTATNLRQ